MKTLIKSLILMLTMNACGSLFAAAPQNTSGSLNKIAAIKRCGLGGSIIFVNELNVPLDLIKDNVKVDSVGIEQDRNLGGDFKSYTIQAPGFESLNLSTLGDGIYIFAPADKATLFQAPTRPQNLPLGKMIPTKDAPLTTNPGFMFFNTLEVPVGIFNGNAKYNEAAPYTYCGIGADFPGLTLKAQGYEDLNLAPFAPGIYTIGGINLIGTAKMPQPAPMTTVAPASITPPASLVAPAPQQVAAKVEASAPQTPAPVALAVKTAPQPAPQSATATVTTSAPVAAPAPHTRAKR